MELAETGSDLTWVAAGLFSQRPPLQPADIKILPRKCSSTALHPNLPPAVPAAGALRPDNHKTHAETQAEGTYKALSITLDLLLWE